MHSKVLVGSRALDLYGITLKPTKDWDFLTESMIVGDGVDSLLLSFESTNKILFDLSLAHGKIIQTPFGEAILAPKAVLFVMYRSMQDALFNHDIADIRIDYYCEVLKNLDKKMSDDDYETSLGLTQEEFSSLVETRSKETTLRFQKQEEYFFTKEVPRLIEHDAIHSEIAYCLGKKNPTFELLLEDNHQTKGSRQKYEALSKQDKISLVFEEVCVFTLERTLIPQIVAMPSMAITFFEELIKVDKFYSPANYWLYMFSKKGGVKKTPSYVSEFIQANYEEITEFFKQNYENTMNSISQEFWENVLKAATKK